MTLTAQKKRRAALTAAVVGAVVAGMVGLSFAAVPLYEAFCRVTGYGGTTQVASGAPARLGRAVEVRFDANAAADLPVTFAPVQRSVQIRLGQTGVAFYRIRNVSDRPVTAIASYNVTPHKAGRYFSKLECFCFEERVFAPGEEAELAVMFYVDPALADDPDTEEVGSVTLSYTYFASADAAYAALEPGS